ncbi:hypothetical protein BOTBODRAFT_127095 [Botryobasidium botryosum FD-172 SS1]|uniref:tRNA-splicing endonuclease subunit Sen2 n=1 Tax=Botryobasidium botryosum (strain FD-172 SS1) TaxID=930990 RepID=A0A067MWU9_BOTB1|nr:hypothetical protein BOTBODRAFT_127095 [Botryobasidium botryosum FD-172 SS1]
MADSPPAHRAAPGKSQAKRGKDHLNAIYAHPLPLLFGPLPADTPLPWATNVLGLFGRNRIVNPKCVGVFDAATRSVWITNSKDTFILWQRGFFGKGNLSRSEPSWLSRRINQLSGPKQLTAEEVTARRRELRKQFKTERAQALAAAAAEAEAIFAATGEMPTPEAVPAIVSKATFQAKGQQSAAVLPGADSVVTPPLNAADPSLVDEVDDAITPPEDMEHLQLTLQEAFFLAWSVGCLNIIDPTTNESIAPSALWKTFLAAHDFLASPDVPQSPWFDNPFLVSYVAFHHYRSLGWVVKSGIKFCVDLLLYKRGPVFHHAEFAIVVIPVYEDPEDRKSSPYDLPNVEPFTWSWLSTINRVNSQVKKTLILTYITIPALRRISAEELKSPECLKHFTVREVTIRRFVPARMRD